jgi:putative phosphoribosyl transferase
MSNRGLPPRPDVEQYKKQAKDLIKSRTAEAPEALERIGKYHPRFQGLPHLDIQGAPFKLSDAQLTIAREHGFPTWSKFAAHVKSARSVSADPIFSIERVIVGRIELEIHITSLQNARGIVLFPQASGAQRYHPNYRYLAREIQGESISTVLMDLLTEDEELADLETGEMKIDVPLLGKRAAELTNWIRHDARFQGLPVGYFSSGTGAAAAMWAAGDRPGDIRAIVSASGRPDLAGPWLWRVQAPTLFVVGSRDTVRLGFTQSILAPIPQTVDRKLAVIEGAHQVDENQDALSKTASLSRNWFNRYLVN